MSPDLCPDLQKISYDLWLNSASLYTDSGGAHRTLIANRSPFRLLCFPAVLLRRRLRKTKGARLALCHELEYTCFSLNPDNIAAKRCAAFRIQ